MREEEKNLTSGQEQGSKASGRKQNDKALEQKQTVAQSQDNKMAEQKRRNVASGRNRDGKTAVQNTDAQRRTDPARRPHRASGPQIYGQSEGMANPQIYGQQGMIRREVPAHGAKAQGEAMNRAGQPLNAPGRAQSEAMNRTGQPVNAPGRAQSEAMNRTGQPVNAPGRAQSEAMNRTGQPVNAPGRAQSEAMNRAGQSMNAPGRAQSEAMNRAGQPMNAPGRAQGEMLKRMEIARAALKSPVFILIAVLNTVFLVGSVTAVFMHQMNYSQFIRLISDISMPTQLVGYIESLKKLLGMLDSGMLPVNLALQLPNLFLCIGFWLLCVTVRTSEEEMSGAGFMCMKISVIIRMIVTCVVLLACLILSVTLVVAAWVSGTRSMIVLAGVMLVAMIIVALAAIMYYFCYLATIKVCRLNTSTGEPYGQVSLYIAVLHVILGLSGIVGLLSGIVNAELSNIVGSIGKIGWMLLFAVWICIYKGNMSEFED